MRIAALFAISASLGLSQVPAPELWNQLSAKRAGLPAYHQEIEVSELLMYEGRPQSSEWKLVVDVHQNTWSERKISGWGGKDRYFRNMELVTVDEGVGEFVRTRTRLKDLTAPNLYDEVMDRGNLDWSKAVMAERQPCGLQTGRICLVFGVPLVKRISFNALKERRRLEGTSQIMVDPETGIVLALAMTEVIEQSKQRFAIKTDYATTTLRYTADDFSPNLSLLREVKRFSDWDAKQLQKTLVGKAPPELSAVDLQGNPVSLSSLAGKTILLDFWASWCPPCREDAPALNKLQSKYGGRELVILGINVGEDRLVVEDFLREHQSKYPIVLSSENQLPRQYHVNSIPTYIIVSADGKVVSAADGDKGFDRLRTMLKKAGLDTN